MADVSRCGAIISVIQEGLSLSEATALAKTTLRPGEVAVVGMCAANIGVFNFTAERPRLGHQAARVATELADGWLAAADKLDEVTDEDDEVNTAIVTQLREDAHALLEAFDLLDYESSASRQHHIETGRYLKKGEAL